MSNRIEMYRFDKGELASLDIMSPKFGKWAGEGEWLNQLIGIAESRGITFYSANYKETSGRDEDGANLFIKLDELGIWRAVLLEFCCEGFLVNGPFTFVAGKHGDDVLKFEGNQITITKRTVKPRMTDKERAIDLICQWSKRADRMADQPEALDRERGELIEKLKALGCIITDLSTSVRDGQVYCNIQISIPKD